MSIFNERFLPIMRRHINQIRAQGETQFYTVDVIKSYLGRYYLDNTSARDSINANIGRFLSENARALGIRKRAQKQPVTDKKGKRSSSALWVFLE